MCTLRAGNAVAGGERRWSILVWPSGSALTLRLAGRIQLTTLPAEPQQRTDTLMHALVGGGRDSTRSRRNVQLAFCRYSQGCLRVFRRAGLFSAQQQALKDAATDHHNCVVDRIESFKKVLSDSKAPRDDRILPAQGLALSAYFLFTSVSDQDHRRPARRVRFSEKASWGASIGKTFIIESSQ